jgi:hypothetical protein
MENKMGVVNTVGFDIFPKQGVDLGKRVRVCFDYDTSRVIEGVMVRCDQEEPFVQIIKLDNGNYVLTEECQYQVSYMQPGE